MIFGKGNSCLDSPTRGITIPTLIRLTGIYGRVESLSQFIVIESKNNQKTNLIQLNHESPRADDMTDDSTSISGSWKAAFTLVAFMLNEDVHSW